jgi:predicted DNA-binding transcriptional regulator YafY
MAESKSRILYIKKYLESQTDENHPAAMTDILAYLEKEGIPASRKTVKQDIALPLESGVDVVCNDGHHYEYFIGERHFEFPELKLLVDAAQAFKFLSEAKTAVLIDKLSAFGSVHQAGELNRQLYGDKQVKTENERVYITVDLLHTAIHAGKQVSFRYFEYDRDKKKTYKHGGYIYAFSPYALLWNSEKYYAVGFSTKHGKVIAFRVDRMAKPKLLDTPAVPKPEDCDVSLYRKSIFQMYGGVNPQKVTLRCENTMMKSIIDSFGESVETAVLDDGHFTVVVDVSLSPTFYGWVFSFTGSIRIISPQNAVAEYLTLARNIASELPDAQME